MILLLLNLTVTLLVCLLVIVYFWDYLFNTTVKLKAYCKGLPNRGNFPKLKFTARLLRPEIRVHIFLDRIRIVRVVVSVGLVSTLRRTYYTLSGEIFDRQICVFGLTRALK